MTTTTTTAPSTGDADKSNDQGQAGAPATGTTTAPSTGDTLGEGGMKALEAERAARKAAEKQIKDLPAKVEAAQNAGKTEAEKQAEAFASLRAEFDAMKAEKARLEIAASTGVPAEFLAGPGDDPVAFAQALKEWSEKQGKSTDSSSGAQGAGVIQHMGNPVGVGAASLAQQIEAAEKAGDRTLVASLKAQMLGG